MSQPGFPQPRGPLLLGGVAVPSNGADWSDSRKRSRFTSGGAAVSPIPLHEIQRLLNELHAAAEFQLSAFDVTQDGEARSEGLSSDARQRVRARLNDVEAAQQRVADGSYGACFGCGRPIPVPRLRALPCSRYCTACDRQLPHGVMPPVTAIPDQRHRRTG
jgi:RNA polymerase-binding transcription factor DksA